MATPQATSGWANPRAVKQARERLRLTQEDVVTQWREKWGEDDEISRAILGRWESGTEEPELSDLELLSELYVCPVGWFFLDSIPAEAAKLDFRGVSPRGVGARGLQAIARFISNVAWIESTATGTSALRKPSLGSAALHDSPSQVADRERKRLGFTAEIRTTWNNNQDAFDWWRKQIEALGVFCFVDKLPPDEVRGASLWGPSGGAFILVNSEDAEYNTGRQFTLLHEYAHLLLGAPYVCDFHGSPAGSAVERFANSVAAHMLVSASELYSRLDELGLNSYREWWPDSALVEIRKTLFVSLDVVAIFLEELGLAPDDFWHKRQARTSPNPRPGKGAFNTRSTAERRLQQYGRSMARLLTHKEIASIVSPLELAEVLDVKIERLSGILAELAEAGAE